MNDLDLLKQVAPLCGFEFKENQKSHAWYGRWLNDWQDQTKAAALKGHNPKTFGKCLHALRLKGHQRGDYEVGVVKALDGNGYELIYDAYGGAGHRLEAAGGEGMSKLADEYNAAEAERSMQDLVADGYTVQRVINDHGEIEVVALKA